MPDTSAAAQRMHDDIVRRLDPEARLRQALELSDTTRALALAQLRRAAPGQPEREIVRQLLHRRYGADLLPPALR